MSTPTMSMRIFGEQQLAMALRRRRSQAAKKAWRTRRRLAVPTPAMRRWLEWLTSRPENVIRQRFEAVFGSTYAFAAYPDTAGANGSPPRFVRNTFWAMQRRGWLENFHRTDDRVYGATRVNGRDEQLVCHYRFWRVTPKGVRAIRRA